ncbi:hypothetical protein P5673_020483 [Acropora cervicornis]|uniref:Uncharacterized protein n=1 Tax=Acropora cervicornis TaxID=6130 RepID=A0AAD9Q9U3_ACRCE|nr:hypothetical protein P5673_020483 [Acropora cervicornis]
MANHKTDLSNPRKDFEELSFASLEIEALNYLDESIRCHETTIGGGEFASEDRIWEKGKLAKQILDSPRELHFPKLNSGYIVFDGCEMKYVSCDKSEKLLASSTEFSSALSSQLTSTSDDSLFRQPSKDSICRLSMAPYKRLPSYVYFTALQKCSLIAVGAAPVLTLNAFFISVAFFLPILGNQVLSEIGICHYVPFLAAMMLIFCGKRRWVPFYPTLPVCLFLMIFCVAVLPGFVLAGFTPSRYTIYGLVTLNGLCAGMGQSLLSRMIVLFPGCKGSSLIRHVVLQAVFILSTRLTPTESPLNQNELCLLALFGMVLTGIFLGLISFITLSRSGIYELFAGRDCVAHSPKNITLGSVPETTKRRYQAIKCCLFAEFGVSLVSYFVLAVAPFIREATFRNASSSTAPFWKSSLLTVLVGVFKAGDFLGLLISRVCRFWPRQNTTGVMFCYLSATFLRLGFVFAAVFFIHAPFLVSHNVFMIAFYFMLALTNGFLSVAMASSCQSFIMGQRKDNCPIVTQLVWLAKVLGATVGIALSFIHISS